MVDVLLILWDTRYFMVGVLLILWILIVSTVDMRLMLWDSKYFSPLYTACTACTRYLHRSIWLNTQYFNFQICYIGFGFGFVLSLVVRACLPSAFSRPYNIYTECERIQRKPSTHWCLHTDISFPPFVIASFRSADIFRFGYIFAFPNIGTFLLLSF